MVNRNVYNEIIEKMNGIYSHHEGFDLENSLNQIVAIRDTFDIKLMVVGHFSAGKSSLLNMLIGKPGFLKEAQEPQTAIATELKYDKNESALAVDLHGNMEKINQQQVYTPQNYNHLEYRIDSPTLEQIGDFTIVDTPGFDAGIEAHAKALSNYIGTGSAYLVIIDQEKGGIDETTLDFIQEISNYSSQIAILINKCDKITAETAEDIAEAARFTLITHGFNYKVYTVSKRDVDIADKLVSIISSFKAQAAFNNVMTRHLRAELLSSEKTLSAIQKRVFLDTFDLDTDIAMYSRIEERLKETFERKRKEAEETLDSTVQEATNRVRSALIEKSDSIAEALLSGNQVAAEAIIVETVRPIMLVTMKDISFRQIDNVTDSLDFTGLVNETEKTDLADIAVSLAESVKNLIEEGTFGIKSTEGTTKLKKGKDIYHVITGIAAIATDVIAPWLEIVIILLPDVISLLQGAFAESDSQLAKRRFVNNVIPQIINKMYPQMKQNIESTTKLILDEYEKAFTEKIENIKKSITDAQNKKEKKIQEFEDYKTIISDDSVIIKKLLSELR